MATTTKGNTKETPAKMKSGASEKSASSKSTATKATTKSTTKPTPSKASATKKTAADTTAAARTAGKSTTAKSASSKSSTGKSTGAKKSSSSSKSSTSTRDHDTIRSWVEKRGGVPSVVKGTAGKKGGDGILRIDFPGYSGEDSLQEISWDEFFQKFDESKLEFLYQETTADGKESRFSKFVSSN
ncbi:hypothetical protein SAMN04487996_101405 [Dyadobacter soli]|uniref:1,4-alpha-glucan branching enzyme n=1 Tax=Dyadobacter soli TaxID=659014 RepID=A0A1G6W3D7_9BACT|nr:hypothetical protein [Dyadobacter soli]SDD59747.1 hypothetical protein SAMN04487996_101405 [Dyadobacter soli]